MGSLEKYIQILQERVPSKKGKKPDFDRLTDQRQNSSFALIQQNVHTYSLFNTIDIIRAKSSRLKFIFKLT